MPIRLVCDRCGNDAGTMRVVTVMGLRGSLVSLKDRTILCEPCSREFDAWLGSSRPAEPEPDPDSLRPIS